MEYYAHQPPVYYVHPTPMCVCVFNRGRGGSNPRQRHQPWGVPERHESEHVLLDREALLPPLCEQELRQR